jgi:uncharacterized membrane protein YhaH (DUF805 family)
MPMSQLLFSFQGRLNRQPYWLTSIAIVVLIILLIAFALAMFGVHDFWAGGTTLALLVILYIPLLWVGLALGAKRLHDRDKSAWWLLLFYLVPSLLSGAANRIDGGGFICISRALPSPSGPSSSSAACAAPWAPTVTAPIRWRRRQRLRCDATSRRG